MVLILIFSRNSVIICYSTEQKVEEQRMLLWLATGHHLLDILMDEKESFQ